ncbi:MAG: FAD-binding domain-containing protein [Pseudanabaenaceae cyanobacterium SKYGB_i_bin29]|nr:deoxyribodipyrimidine photo-lyase [Pseudanabaenaceae cyanobacterium SKYG29]MDW8422685.1 FAD-binding domain-containing protein [Pseudanabaenaceae cyanobacterium SKYGB_i_bin29]
MKSLNLVWHRRDLRLDDNPAVYWAWQGDTVAGVFIFDPAILYSPETGGGKVEFMLGCLQELRESYRELGSDLLFFFGSPPEVWRQIVALCQPQRVFFNEDVEPSALDRDNKVRAVLQELGVEVRSFWDIGLHAPQELQTKTKEPYKVFTPYWKNWQSLTKPKPYDRPTRRIHLSQVGTMTLPTLAELKFSHNQIIPQSGEKEAQRLLEEFSHPKKILQYRQQRDFPAVEGTSRLSPHLRFGTIGIRRVWQMTEEIEVDVRTEEEKASLTTWRQELAWREFYQHVLFFFPELAERAYQPRMLNFPWENREDYFHAWCEGRTGYPIVDAAMRQLNQTGWMHNRCRMIVASFLTKDLLVSWQWGERYFMQKLIDGDQTANNGGWQWSASSGMDPRPLRIFNPATQAKNYDPHGQYIRTWLPELADLSTVELVTGTIPPSKCKARDYPLPLVDHNEQQKKFKSLYREG